MNQTRAADTDIVLVGAGIMSATLAVFLKELEPSLRIEIFETLEGAALESSDAWNNAGTGHAALCELNYTPQRSDGSIDISKALAVNVEFDLSRQFWSYLIRKKATRVARSVRSRGAAYELRPWRRARRLSEKAICRADRAPPLPGHGIHRGQADARDWFPLVMEGRPDSDDCVAVDLGADVAGPHRGVRDHVVDRLLPAPAERVHAGVHDQPAGAHRVRRQHPDPVQRRGVQPHLVGEPLGVEPPALAVRRDERALAELRDAVELGRRSRAGGGGRGCPRGSWCSRSRSGPSPRGRRRS